MDFRAREHGRGATGLRIFAASAALLFSLVTLFTGPARANPEIPFPLSAPLNPYTCYPYDVGSKRYVAEGYAFPFGKWRSFTCSFACLDHDGVATAITGTQTDMFRFSETGQDFACKGFVLGFVETPYDEHRFGTYMIKSIAPFNARTSQIPEIVSWSQQQPSCH